MSELVLVEGEAVVVATDGFFVNVGVFCGCLGAFVDHDEEFLLFFVAFDLGFYVGLFEFDGGEFFLFFGGYVVKSDGTI